MTIDWKTKTIYTDIPIPFTKYVLIIDVGRHSCLGYRHKR